MSEETIDEIAGALYDADTPLSVKGQAHLADRIGEAIKRERIQRDKVSFRCGDCARFGNDCNAGDADGNEDRIACERFVRRSSEPVTKCNGLGTMTLDEAIEHAESKSDATPCGLEHAALAEWLRELRQYKNGKCGNASKLREALRIANNAHWFHMNPALRELVAAALAAPPRNCDVGTAEEQAHRFFAFCHAHRTFDTACSDDCPFKDGPDEAHCLCGWGQLPYDAAQEEQDDCVAVGKWLGYAWNIVSGWWLASAALKMAEAGIYVDEQDGEGGGHAN